MLSRNILTKAILLRSLKNVAANNKQITRNAGHGVWSYRVPPPLPSKKTIYLAEVLGGLCWWWILYHIATEPEHVYGEWPYISPKTWTDEELGIPPDSAGSIKRKI